MNHGTRHISVRLLIVTALLVDVSPAPAATAGELVRSTDDARFHVKPFLDESGRSFAQTEDLIEAPDGSIWVATWGEGVTRVRGSSWTSYDDSNGLPSNWIRALAAAADGTVWIGTSAGLVRVRGDELRTYTAANTPYLPTTAVYELAVMRDGSLWVAFEDEPLVMRYAEGESPPWTVVVSSPELPTRVRSIAQGQDGSAWLSFDWHVMRISDGRSDVFRMREGSAANDIVATPRGEVWAIQHSVVSRFDGGDFVSELEIRSGDQGRCLAVDTDGDIVIGTRTGLFRRVDEDWVPVRLPGPRHCIRLVFSRDRATMWVGTINGLLRGRRPSWKRFSRSAEETALIPRSLWFDDRVGAICADTDGNLLQLVGTQWRVRRHIGETFRPHAMLADRSGRVWALCDETLVEVDFDSGETFRTVPFSEEMVYDESEVRHRLFASADDEIWVYGRAGVFALEDDGFHRRNPRFDGAFRRTTAVAQDGDGSFWVCLLHDAGDHGRLERWIDGRVESLEDRFPLLRGQVFMTIACTRDGRVWVGTEDIGILILDGDGLTRFSREEGLESRMISRIFEGRDGTMWIGYRRKGIASFCDGRWVSHRDGNGPSGWRIDNLGEDAAGRLWCAMHPGENFLPEQRLGVYLYDPDRQPPETTVVGPSERVHSHGVGVFSFAARDAWDATSAEDLTYSWRAVPLDDRRPPTAWSPFSRSTTAVTDSPPLPPGEYRFEVRSSDLDRNVDETPASFVFVVDEPFWQKPAFVAPLVVLGMIAIVAYVLQRRERRSRRRAECELAQAQKLEAVGRLSAGIAHDLNNTLTAILGYAELARHGEDDELQTCLDGIGEATEQGVSVTRSLLTFSGKVVSSKSTIRLEGVIRAATRLLGRLLPASIELRVTCDDSVPMWINADAVQIQRVIMNLALNSRDAMPDGGVLEIRARARGRVVFSVEDTGTGIDPSVRDRIFEPFFTTKSRGQGTGLGMSIVHGIVSEHGGDVRVDGEPGQGTRVTLTLPLVDSPDELSEDERSSAPAPPGGETVLLVEDNQHVLEVLRRTTQAIGYTPVLAGDGAQGLAVARRSRELAIAIIDLDLPRMDGRSCARELRKIAPGVPIIVVTGNRMLLEALDAGTVNEVLLKPFTGEELVDTIARVVDESVRRVGWNGSASHGAEASS